MKTFPETVEFMLNRHKDKPVRISARFVAQGMPITYGECILTMAEFEKMTTNFNDILLEKIRKSCLGSSGDYTVYLGEYWHKDERRVPVKICNKYLQGLYITGIDGLSIDSI